MTGQLLRNYTREVVDAIKKDGWDDWRGRGCWTSLGALPGEHDGEMKNKVLKCKVLIW